MSTVTQQSAINFSQGPQFRRAEREAKDDEICRIIETFPVGTPWGKILHNNDHNKQLMRKATWAKAYHTSRPLDVELRTITDVVICFGASGSGKTHHVMSQWPNRTDVWFQGRSKWFGEGNRRYVNQAALVFDEYGFENDVSLDQFKAITNLAWDGPDVEIKGGMIKLNHSHVYFTSQFHPLKWFKRVEFTRNKQNWRALARRFTSVRYYPDNRPDGRVNVGSAEEPGHFIELDIPLDYEEMLRHYEEVLGEPAYHTMFY